jgi:hypothetical protein
MMVIKSIESLPNEIWLLFMNYLTSIDLFRSMFGLNHRINCLLVSISSHLVLDTFQCGKSGIRFSDMRQLIEGNNYWSKCLLSSIDTIRLSGTLSSDALCSHWQSPIPLSSRNTSFSILFSSLRRLYVTGKAIKRSTITELLVPLSKSLRYIHVTFQSHTKSSQYFEMLHTINDHQVSVYSMVFNVKNGNFFQ